MTTIIDESGSEIGQSSSLVAMPVPPDLLAPLPEPSDHPREIYAGSDYADDEWEFIRTIERFKREKNVRYPLWRDVLNVLKSLGYRKEHRS